MPRLLAINRLSLIDTRAMSSGSMERIAATEKENVGGTEGPPCLFEKEDEEDNAPFQISQ
jgi:hypothetical protein